MGCEEKNQEIQDAEENKEALLAGQTDEPSIYHYMKEHPGFFAALVSALVAIIAFVLNAAEYRRISSYLRYWGFNAENIQIEVGNHIYILALVFVFIIALAGVALFLNQALTVFQNQENVLFYLRVADKNLSREIFKIRFGNLCLRFLIWFYNKKGADANRVAELNGQRLAQNARLDALKEQTKSRQKTIRLLRTTNLIRLLPSLLIAYGLILLFLDLAGITDVLKTSIRYPTLGLCIFVMILMGIIYCVVRFETRTERRNIKKMLKSDDKGAAAKIEKLAEENRKRYPTEWIFKSKAEELFNNKTIILAAVLVVMCLAYAFAVFSDPSEDTTVAKNTFSVIDVDGQTYTIIYNSDTIYYLNEVEIDVDQNIIKVYTKKQRVIASDDMVYDIVEFNSAEVDPPIAGNEDQRPSETPDSSVTESE